MAGLEDEQENVYLFDANRLKNLTKWPEIDAELKGKNLHARPLKLADYNNGYLELLSQLTSVGQVSQQEFEKRFGQMRDINAVQEHYLVVVIVDNTTRKVVGCSTFLLEFKFIHECANRGRLEDVAVLESYRGKRIGELVVRLIVELARESFGCYKLSLDCSDDLKRFYAKNNFSYACNMMSIRF